jgi:plasmid rolling circle replication initiator protein Rep
MEFLHSDERILSASHNTTQQFLTDYSPTDKPWDTNKAFNGEVLKILDSSDKRHHQKQAERMKDCADNLEFGWVLFSTETGETKLRLKSARFCRVRHCPICQWRRALMWISRFFDAFPKIYAEYPEMRYIMLTVTVKNCEIAELRTTVDRMANAWNKLTKRKDFPAEGFVRSLEVTRGKDGSAHPHFHILLAVPPSYFNGRSYLSKDKWAELWRSAMKLDYKPVCDVRIVKERKEKAVVLEGCNEPKNDKIGAALMSAITETIKYTTKPADMVKDKAWLLEMVSQMRNVRAISMGGIFKRFLKESEENQDLITASETDIEKQTVNEGGLHFGWREKVKKYAKKDK